MTRLALPLILATVLVTHLIMAERTEPFYNGDETRHVMTGIFMADAFTEGGLAHPIEFAERYYAQYPALGLIVWPPGFYAVEGATMLAFGRSFETARWLTLSYCLLACIFAYRLVKFTHDEPTAIVATLVFACSREVFFHSRNVMLEVPTTAFVLMTMLFLERFLKTERRRDLVWLAFACILAGLHRYDAVLLLLYVGFRILFARRWDLVKRRSVWLAALAVIVTLAPVYLLAVLEIGGVQSSAVSAGSDPTSTDGRFTLFFTTLWAQIGHVAFALSIIGLLLSFRNRSKNGAYWAVALATYLFFAPMGEQESRHAIFWIIAWSTWAAAVAMSVPSRAFRVIVSVLLVGGTLYWTLSQPVPWVRGYGNAAEIALRETDGIAVVLFDGHFSGTIVYEMRTQDAEQRVWIARADKLFYASLSDPSHSTVEYAKDEAAIRAKLAELAPDLVIVESPRARTDTPSARRFREMMAAHEGYSQIAVVPVESNGLRWLEGVQLLVYKPKVPRLKRERRLTIPMLWQGGRIDAVIEPK